jgi:general secretion pathway protein N
MTASVGTLGFVAGLILMALSAAFAAAPTTQDVLSPGITGGAGITILEADKLAPAAAKQQPPAKGNPLWAIPLSKLSATRERPIFLPSRRVPAPAVASAPRELPKPMAAPPEERPRFALVGAVSGENEAIAVFVDQATKNVIRLRTGQNHDGWVLSSVKGRAATLQKNQKTLVFNLPAPGSSPLAVTDGGAPGVLSAATAAALPSPAASSNLVVPDPTVAAPFIPRSTPKHGEPDGL